MKNKRQLRFRNVGYNHISKYYIIIFLIIGIPILILIANISGDSTTKQEQKTIEINVPDLNISVDVAVPLIQAEPINPKPSYTPILNPMRCYNKNDEIWYPCNPSDYITPSNEWVKYYASQLFVDKDGYIKYKNEQVIWWTEFNGNIHYTNKVFTNNYYYDWEQFGTGSKGSLANDDYWANVDYYLTHGMTGDCDEWSNTITSMMLSGEMSVWREDKLVKQVIPAKSVMGYVGGITDVWTEYQIYNTSRITSTSRKKDGYGAEISATIFIEKDNQFNPIYEFTDKYFRRV